MENNCACGANTANYRDCFSAGETDFKICPSCGVLVRARFPTPSELDEIYRRAYLEENIDSGDTNQESGDFASQSYGDFILRNLLNPAATRVLDYGAASGGLVEYLRGRGAHADGVEFAHEARQYCREHRGFHLMGSLLEAQSAAYDFCSMIEVIEHLTDLREALLEIHRTLKPGGTLLVTTPNRNTLRARLDKGHWREAQKKFHLYLFDAASLSHHLRAAGFEIERQVVFSPLQREGLKFLVRARLLQLIRMPGTLCVIARRSQ